MKRVTPSASWPPSWIESYNFDRQEIYGELTDFGYVYAYQNRLKHTLAMVAQVAPAGAKILDLGAGQGNFSLHLAEAGYNVTWNDLRAELANYVKLKHSHGSLRYQPGNAFELSPAEEQYDLLLALEIIEHVAHPDLLLRQVASLTRPGGHIIITTPNGEYFRNNLPRFSDCPEPSLFEGDQFKPNADGHIFLLHQDEIERLARQCGLVLRELRFFTNPLTNGHVKTEGLLHLSPRAGINWLEIACQSLPPVIKRKLFVHMGAILCKPAL